MHIEQRRGGLTETLHPVSAALWADGAVRWSVGPDIASFWRSGCKALQLTSSLNNLPAEIVAGLTEQELAIGAASHSAEPLHVERVVGLLDRFGLTEADLRCGAHRPMHEPSARALERKGEKPSQLHNNCSGKHTFMRAAARYSGWPADYRDPDHPLQRENLARMTEWMGEAPAVAVDGCGVPSFHGRLSAMARAVARLAEEMGTRAVPGTGTTARIGWAMHRNPRFMSGEGRLDLLVVEGATEPLTVKVGAEGLFTIALPDRQAGLVVKCHTGNDAALAVAVAAVLDRVYPGILRADAVGGWSWGTVLNVVGVRVGDRRAVW